VVGLTAHFLGNKRFWDATLLPELLSFETLAPIQYYRSYSTQQIGCFGLILVFSALTKDSDVDIYMAKNVRHCHAVVPDVV
jgi:hypothetical protein